MSYHRTTSPLALQINLCAFLQFHDVEAKRARSEYDKMILRQELEEEELRVSQDAAIKELQLLQVQNPILEYYR